MQDEDEEHDHEGAHEDGRSNHDQEEEKNLLESVYCAQVDSVQASQGHGTDDEKESVYEPDAMCGSACSPEDYRRDHTCCHEVSVVQRDEVARWQPATKTPPRSDEGSEKSHWVGKDE